MKIQSHSTVHRCLIRNLTSFFSLLITFFTHLSNYTPHLILALIWYEQVYCECIEAWSTAFDRHQIRSWPFVFRFHIPETYYFSIIPETQDARGRIEDAQRTLFPLFPGIPVRSLHGNATNNALNSIPREIQLGSLGLMTIWMFFLHAETHGCGCVGTSFRGLANYAYSQS